MTAQSAMTGCSGGAEMEALAAKYYAPGDGTRKGVVYFSEYENLLQNRRNEPLRILEIGVSSGASLLIWRDYLPNATIVGIDIDEMPERLRGLSRLHVLRGSQDDPAILDLAAATAGGPFDLIVDDASHIGYLTKRALYYLFPRWLRPGGWYAIEDIGTAFLPPYPDGAAYADPAWNDAAPDARRYESHQFGMVGVVKQIIDLMMCQLMTGKLPVIDVERLVMRSNIALLEKSLRPQMPFLPMPTGAEADAPPPPEPSAPGLAALEARVGAQEARLAVVERRLGRLVGPLLPFWRCWRALGGAKRCGGHAPGQAG